jgi:hypothetical protein
MAHTIVWATDGSEHTTPPELLGRIQRLVLDVSDERLEVALKVATTLTLSQRGQSPTSRMRSAPDLIIVGTVRQLTAHSWEAVLGPALFPAAEEIREELCGAGSPAPTASLVIVVVVVAMTVVIVVVATMMVVVSVLALVASGVAPLRVQQLLELATVEEDSPAFLALVDQDAVALVGAHLAATFRASQDRCVSHFVLLV